MKLLGLAHIGILNILLITAEVVVETHDTGEPLYRRDFPFGKQQFYANREADEAHSSFYDDTYDINFYSPPYYPSRSFENTT